MLKELFEKAKVNALDIREHLDTLLRYSNECQHITEFGVRYADGSTLAFLNSSAPIVISYDIVRDPNVETLQNICNNNNRHWEFKQINTHEANIDVTDLLFIDTLHIYDQIKKELELHHSKVRKYIIFHDVVSYKVVGEVKGKEGIGRAIFEFLRDHPNWKVHELYENNNGLLVIKRED